MAEPKGASQFEEVLGEIVVKALIPIEGAIYRANIKIPIFTLSFPHERSLRGQQRPTLLKE